MTIRVPPLLTWHICEIVVDYFALVVTTCVLNQFKGHWLLSDALHSTISISLKLKKKLENAPFFQTLMEEDFSVALESICLASNTRKKVCGVLNSFGFVLEEFDEKNHIIR
jgi:hypothetical protein